MTKLTITINTENAAFDDNPQQEVRRILRKMSANWGSIIDTIYDSNGNKVGNVTSE